MTEQESRGLSASAHLEALRRHAPRLPIHDVLLNDTAIPDRVLARYAARGAFPVACDEDALAALGCSPVKRRLLADSRKVRHDPHAVAAALLELAACHSAERPVLESAARISP
jgi:2-phospho-L-lactate transferase/gluconeogenesis factor (CofD/UPF0052 family)